MSSALGSFVCSCQVAFRLIPLGSSHFLVVFTLTKTPRTNPSERDEAMHAELSKPTPGIRHLLLTKFDVGRAWAAEVAATDLHCEDMWMQMGTNRDDVVRAVQDILDLDVAGKEGRTLQLKFLAIQHACRLHMDIMTTR